VTSVYSFQVGKPSSQQLSGSSGSDDDDSSDEKKPVVLEAQAVSQVGPTTPLFPSILHLGLITPDSSCQPTSSTPTAPPSRPTPW
jgi:hypothetical protein